MALNAGTAFVDIQPSLGAGFAGKLQGLMGGSGILKAAGIAGVGIGAAIGGGIALAKIGETFDEAFDTIRLGTGATGTDLEGLKTEFKDVFASIPTDAETAATAIADLNTRTGLTGDSLEELARKELELARITGSDIGSTVRTTTRLFGDWGIATDDQAETLDKLWRASQATGASVDDLAGSAVKFGAPLRQMGFGLDETLGLLGKFEKEGVNADLVMGSLRIALGNMARAGEEPQEAFKRLTGEIADAGDAGQANALAMELFGARAGPDMAAAIREGRFEIGDLFDQISGGSETIEAAASDTESMSEKWQTFKNKVLVAIQPIATKFFDLLGSLMDRAGPALETFAKVIGDVFGFISGLFGGAGDASEKLKGTVGSTVGSMSGIFAAFGDVVGGIFEFVKVILTAAREFWAQWGDTIMGVVRTVFDTVKSVIEGALKVIKGIIDVVLGVLTGDWSRAWEGVKGIFSGVWEAIKGILSGAVSAIGGIITGLISNVWTGLRDGFAKAVAAVWDIMKSLPGKILSAIAGIPAMLLNLGRDMVAGIINGLGDITGKLGEKIKSGISGAVSKVKSFFGIHSPSRFIAEEIGRPLGEGISAGITATAGQPAVAFRDLIAEGAAAGSAAAEAELRNLANSPLNVTAGLTTATAGNGGPGLEPAGGSGITFELAEGAIQVNNPLPETPGMSIAREMRRLEVSYGRG